MGRSKFPGKPSKLATKKRVSVLAPPTIPGGGAAPSKSPPLVIGLTNKDNSPDSSSSSKSSGGLSTAAGLERIINPENVLSANKCSDVTGGGAIIAASVNAATSVNIRVAKVAHSEPLLLPKLPCPCQGVKSGEGCAKCAFNNNCGSVVGLGGNASSMEYGSGAGAASRGENLMSSHNFHNGDKPAQDSKHRMNGVQSPSQEHQPQQSPSDGSSPLEAPSAADPSSQTTTAMAKKSRKKTVTFKSVLETSDDIAVKKVYNPSGAPLVPIIKKESLIRSTECIVKPSRLTEIVKQSSFNNLNRIKTLGLHTNDDRDEEDDEEPAAAEAGEAVTARTASAAAKENGAVENGHEKEAEAEEDEEEPEGKVAMGDKRFILPKRSLHSRRVIKPNKKFLDDMDGCSAKALKRVNSGNKSKVAVKAEAEEGHVAVTLPTTTTTTTAEGKAKSRGVAFQEPKESSSNSGSQAAVLGLLKEKDAASSKEMANLFGQPVNSVGTNLNLTPFGSNKVILRQPRLQFAIPLATTTTSSSGSNNLFGFSPVEPIASVSSLSTSTNLPIKTSSLIATGSPMICAICSANITINIFKTSRALGAKLCKLCRKFISKKIKRSDVGTENSSPLATHSVLQCLKGEGKCPIDAGAPKTKRCPACWLARCLKTYQLSSSVRSRLLDYLPRAMRDSLGDSSKAAAAAAATLSVLSTPLLPGVASGGAGSSSPFPSASKPLSPFSIKREENENLVPSIFGKATATTSGASSATTAASLHTTTPANSSTWSTAADKSETKDGVQLSSKKLGLGAIFSKPLAESSNSTGRVVAESNSKEAVVVNVKLETMTTGDNKLAGSNLPKSVTSAEDRLLTGLDSTMESSKELKESPPLKEVVEKPGRGRPKKIVPAVNVVVSGEPMAGPSGKEVVPGKENPADKTAISTANPADNNSKRQKIDLKGPRVKHVCRSASIVLGQPLATFPLENLDTPPRPDSPSNVNMVDTQNRLDCSSCFNEDEQQNLGLSPPATPINGDQEAMETDYVVPESTETLLKALKEEPLVYSKGTRKAGKTIVSTIPSLPLASRTNSQSGNMAKRSAASLPHQIKCQSMQQVPTISIDFWENYDPVEISQMGFGLIVTEPVPLRSICFLCGSLGSPDSLMYCVCCCEPYHQFCLEDEYNIKPSLDETMNVTMYQSGGLQQDPVTAHLNFLCPRCTVCNTCNMSSGTKLKCQKCQRNYHSTCLGTSKLLGADRPLICATCLKCKSCGTTNVAKFVGNLPMCKACFKLRQRGNYCPLCQKCYEENDFDLKMMECGECQKWVHARCEGLTDEQYNMLSLLPEKIEFFCRRCTRGNPNLSDMWREAVAAEFKAGLLSVVKLMSKSRQACALLRMSPRKKSNICICQPINSSRAIQFKRIGDMGVLPALSESGAPIKLEDNGEARCYCQANQKISPSAPSLLDIKRKINDNEYVSLHEFNYEVLRIINAVACEDLLTTYKEILSEAFPWFQNETKACTDALVEDMYGGTNEEMDCPSSAPCSSSVDPCEEQMVPNGALELPEDADEYFYGKFDKPDSRSCLFCKKIGEGIEVNEYDEGRLLYSGQNTWVHTNCALWSAEVFEEIDGSLQNIHSAVSRGRMIKCSDCGNRGATVGCNLKNCGEHYHYPCAKRVNCAFMDDKTVYCPRHLTESVKKKCQMERDFDVLRPVYVELDRKRKKSIEVNRIQFMIGSLTVKKLGRLVPAYSDSEEALIPVDFLCSRLYWSMKEPWKVVEYTVRTIVHSSSTLNCGLREGPNRNRHFIIDHSMNSGVIQLGLSQISRWHSSLNEMSYGEEEMGDGAKAESSLSFDHLPGSAANCQQVNQISTVEEEPQNNADLLPPEIKEVIFDDDDLPHDLLDGILSDIFPKLMNYEDLMAMDSTNKEGFFNNNELSKDSRDNCSDDDEGNSQTSVDSFPQATSMLHVEDALLSSARPLSSMARELKRSKSEVFGRGNGHPKNVVSSMGNNNNPNHRSQQRSSSFTWNTKMDPYSAKRRKVTMLQELGLSESAIRSLGSRSDFNKASPVDRSLVERRKSFQLLDEPKSKSTFSWNATKKFFQVATGEGGSSEGVKELERFKISQLDGMEDLSSDESGSPEVEYETKQMIVYDLGPAGQLSEMEVPVQCDRCHCAYRTNESYQRHLATCEPLSSTSESESEANSRSPEADQQTNIVNVMTVAEMSGAGGGLPTATVISTPQGMVQSFNGQIINANYGGLANMLPIQTASGHQVQTIPINGLNQLNGHAMQNVILGTTSQQTQSFMQPMNGGAGAFQHPSTIFPIQNITDLTSATNFLQQKGQNGTAMPLQLANTINFANTQNSTSSGQQIISLSNGQSIMTIPQISNYTTTTTTTVKSNNSSIIHTSSSQGTQQQQQAGSKKIVRLGPSQAGVHRLGKVKQTLVPKTSHPGGTLKRVMAKPADGTRPIQMMSSNLPMIRPQQGGQQTIHATSVNAAPTIVNAAGLGQNIIFQQQPQQSQASAQPIIVQQMPNGMLQYVSAAPQAMDPNQGAGGGMQYILPAQNAAPVNYNTGSYQLQQDASGNLILANTSGIQMLSAGGMQIAAQQQGQVQPQVIGTIIQPQATTIQCGMMSAEQMMMGGTQTLEMVQDPASGCMYLTQSQPVYYGLETIVQNTVMSSQQFVSTAMQGVLSQNSICQATTTQVFQASKIEPIMEVPGGYVVLNNVADLQQQQQQSVQPKVNSHGQAQIIPVSSSSGGGGGASSNYHHQQDQQQQQHLIQRQLVQSQQHHHVASQPTQVISHHHHHHQQPIIPQQNQSIRSISPAAAAVKPTVKTSPIVITKIQPTVTASRMENHHHQAAAAVSSAKMAHHQQVILPKPETGVTVTVASGAGGASHSAQMQVINQGNQQPGGAVSQAGGGGGYGITVTTVAATGQPMMVPPLQRSTTMVKPTTAGILSKVGGGGVGGIKPRGITKPVTTAKIVQQHQPQRVVTGGLGAGGLFNRSSGAGGNGGNEAVPVVISSGAYNGQQQQHVENSITIQPIIEGAEQLPAQRVSITTATPVVTVSSGGGGVDQPTTMAGQAGPPPHQYQYKANNNNHNQSNHKATSQPQYNIQPQQPLIKGPQGHQQHQTIETVKTMRFSSSSSSQQGNNAGAGKLSQTGSYNAQSQAQMHTSTSSSYTGATVTYHQYQQPAQTPQIQLPNAPYAQTSQLTIPTNVVNPIQQSHANYHHSGGGPGYGCPTMPTRPMNRVLPMQTIPSRPSPPTPPEPKNHTEHENSPIRTELDTITLEIRRCDEGGVVLMEGLELEEVNRIATTEEAEIKSAEELEAAEGQLLSPSSHASNHSTLVIDVPESGGSPSSSDDLNESSGAMEDVKASAEELFDSLKNSTATSVAIEGLEEQEVDDGVENAAMEQMAETESNDMKQKISDILVSLDKDVDMEGEGEQEGDKTALEQDGRFSLEPLRRAPSEAGKGNSLSLEKENRNQENRNPTFGIPSNFLEVKKSRMANALQTLSSSATMNNNDAPPGGGGGGQIAAGSKLYFEIESQDGFTYRSTSINEIWEKVFEGVQQSRKAYGLSRLPEGPLADMAGYQMLGLKTNPMRYLLEQLPGLEGYKKYTPKYHPAGSGAKDNSAWQQGIFQSSSSSPFGYGADAYEELKENPYGAVRCEPYAERSEYDMFSWLASRHRKQPAPVVVQNDSDLIIPRRGSSSNLPMAMRYRTLKETSKQSVGVFRSHIHGRGLFCTRDIESGEMVIEYAGELIRATLTDKREKYYESKGIGCYMFRIDDNFVVDATMRGNAARFINHSCEPNCYSKVVDILGHKHIIIFAIRRIVPGEELTYDYKFPFEDDKIPCSCGSKRCRKYLN